MAIFTGSRFEHFRLETNTIILDTTIRKSLLNLNTRCLPRGEWNIPSPSNTLAKLDYNCSGRPGRTLDTCQHCNTVFNDVFFYGFGRFANDIFFLDGLNITFNITETDTSIFNITKTRTSNGEKSATSDR